MARYSRHAERRMQQRSIPLAATELLLDYGYPTPAGGGATLWRFDRKSWRTMQSALGPSVRAFEKFRNAYLIEGGDGTIVTAAWLH